MKGKEPDAHQRKAIEALSIVADILKEENIPYFLLAGTTLGAVREKGMIAWDDDIDLGIYLEDEEKVAVLLEEKLPPDLAWLDRHVDKTYGRLHGKVVFEDSCLIDVFPLVRMSDKPLLRKFQWAERKVLSKLYKAKKPNANYVNRHSSHQTREKLKVLLSNLLSHVVPMPVLEWRIRRNAWKYSGKETMWVVNMYSVYSMEKELIRSQWLEKPTMVSFEGREYPAPGDTDAYLTKLYGDYMTPPPVEKRGSTHDSVF